MYIACVSILLLFLADLSWLLASGPNRSAILY